jgi:hypothetical protein
MLYAAWRWGRVWKVRVGNWVSLGVGARVCSRVDLLEVEGVS